MKDPLDQLSTVHVSKFNMSLIKVLLIKYSINIIILTFHEFVKPIPGNVYDDEKLCQLSFCFGKKPFFYLNKYYVLDL